MNQTESPLIRFREDPAIIAILEEEVARDGGSISSFMRRITRNALRARGRDVPAVLLKPGRKRTL